MAKSFWGRSAVLFAAIIVVLIAWAFLTGVIQPFREPGGIHGF